MSVSSTLGMYTDGIWIRGVGWYLVGWGRFLLWFWLAHDPGGGLVTEREKNIDIYKHSDSYTAIEACIRSGYNGIGF